MERAEKLIVAIIVSITTAVGIILVAILGMAAVKLYGIWF
jgi:hypothetical protein